MQPAADRLPRIVILGGGFGGLYAARVLRHTRADVTVLDRKNHHLFQPLLYQVATAGLGAPDIAAPIREVLSSQKNTTVLLGDVTGIDPKAKRINLKDGTLDYDYLLIATGATHSYFGNDQWAPFAPGLKTLDDAFEIRRRVFMAYEEAERESDPVKRTEWLTFAVIGAGPTGVELAGALSEIAKHTLKGDFRRINPADARVILIEGAPRVLPPFVPELSESAVRQLKALGVEVRTGAKVTGIDGHGVELLTAGSGVSSGSGTERIATKTVLWAAGVQASPIAKSLGVPLDRAGRIIVEKDLSVPGYPEIFAAGDIVAFEQDGKPVPGVAPAAMQEGPHAARNILKLIGGHRTEPFRYFDKGSLATIGRKSAVADIQGMKLTGFTAWFAWLAIHIFFLIGFRNRIIVMINWAWAYLTFRRGARIVTGDDRPAR